MIDSALIVYMSMVIISGCVLGAQITFDSFNITLTNFQGEPVRSHIVTVFSSQQINDATEQIIIGNYTGNSTYYDPIETFTTAAAFIAWEVITMLAGIYILNFLFLMGVPLWTCVLMALVYLGFLVSRAAIGYVRGI